MAITNNAILILNTIRSNMNELFKQKIPKATQDNLTQVGHALIGAPDEILNDFISALVNKVALTDVKSRVYRNKLKVFKSSKMPYGYIAEETFVNPTSAMEYSNDGNLLLKDYTPQGFTAYYRMNRKDFYPVSINEEDLKRAFVSEQEFMRFYNSILSACYSGDNWDEELLTKKLMGGTVDKGAIYTIDADIEKPKELAKSIANIAKDFSEMRTEYIPYNLVNNITDDSKKAKGFCPKEEQVLILRNDVETEIDYELVASFYHIPTEIIERNTITIDSFMSETKDIFAMLVDKASIQLHDNYLKMKKQEIGSALRWNYFLHHGQTNYFSMFGNAVAFALPE